MVAEARFRSKIYMGNRKLRLRITSGGKIGVDRAALM
jgi:hypothetical protein